MNEHFYMWKISSKIIWLPNTKFFTFNFCSTIQKLVIFKNTWAFIVSWKAPLKAFAFQMVFSDAALTCTFPLSVGSWLPLPILLGQGLSSLNCAVANITFIDFMQSLIYCKICSFISPSICIASANMVSSWGDQLLRKGQTFPFWQEGVLILMVRRFGVGTEI